MKGENKYFNDIKLADEATGKFVDQGMRKVKGVFKPNLATWDLETFVISFNPSSQVLGLFMIQKSPASTLCGALQDSSKFSLLLGAFSQHLNDILAVLNMLFLIYEIFCQFVFSLASFLNSSRAFHA